MYSDAERLTDRARECEHARLRAWSHERGRSAPGGREVRRRSSAGHWAKHSALRARPDLVVYLSPDARHVVGVGCHICRSVTGVCVRPRVVARRHLPGRERAGALPPQQASDACWKRATPSPQRRRRTRRRLAAFPPRPALRVSMQNGGADPSPDLSRVRCHRIRERNGRQRDRQTRAGPNT